MASTAACFVLLACAGAPLKAQAQVVGSIPGQLAIDQGTATYSVMLEVPSGVAGMQPALTFNYSSSADNGLLGVGWALGGLSALTRCPKNKAQDGKRTAIQLTENDRFCLDGERLVAVSGVYGAHGTEYRTETDGFARVKSYGSQGSGPDHFVVETKSGQTIEYGKTGDSQRLAEGYSEALTWAQNAITDALGNTVTFTYVDDGPSGAGRIEAIEYRNGASKLTFHYETREDVIAGFIAGAEQRLSHRLDHVELWDESVLVGRYDLTYEASPETGRSRLIELTQCARRQAVEQCFKPLVFGWDAGSAGCQYNTVYESPEQFVNDSRKDRGVRLADVNGDGLVDLLKSVEDTRAAYKNLGAGNGWDALGTAFAAGFHPPLPFVSSTSTDRGTRMVDLDADGLPDMLRSKDRARDAYRSTGSGWEATPELEPPTDIVGNGGKDKGRRFVDLDGDGYVDLL